MRWIFVVWFCVSLAVVGATQTPTPDIRTDINQDGVVDLKDFLLLLAHWHHDFRTPTPTIEASPTIATPTPEFTPHNTYTPTSSPTVSPSPATPTETITPEITPTATETPTSPPTPAPTATPEPLTSISGYVDDYQTEERLANAVVLLEFLVSPTIPAQYAHTNQQGNYQFLQVPLGVNARLTASHPPEYYNETILLTIPSEAFIPFSLIPKVSRTPTQTITPSPTQTLTPTESPTPETPPTHTPTATLSPTITPTFIAPTPTASQTPITEQLVGTWYGSGTLTTGTHQMDMTITTPGHASLAYRANIWQATYSYIPSTTHWDFVFRSGVQPNNPQINLFGNHTSTNRLEGQLEYKGSGMMDPWQYGTFTLRR